jgi:alpha-mannosidase
VAVEPQSVRLVALKRARDGRGLVLRLVEVDGQATDASVKLAPELLDEATTAMALDTLERPCDEPPVRRDGDRLSVPIPAFGIVTLGLIP